MGREKVRLKVVPETAYRDGTGRQIISEKPVDKFANPEERGIPVELRVAVRNLRAFGLTVMEVGFGDLRKVERLPLLIEAVRLARAGHMTVNGYQCKILPMAATNYG